MTPSMKKVIKSLNLQCLSIGLKCISPPDDTVQNDGLRIFNRSVRDSLYKELRECFVKKRKLDEAIEKKKTKYSIEE
jgi:hypothetical protein